MMVEAIFLQVEKPLKQSIHTGCFLSEPQSLLTWCETHQDQLLHNVTRTKHDDPQRGYHTVYTEIKVPLYISLQKFQLETCRSAGYVRSAIKHMQTHT